MVTLEYIFLASYMIIYFTMFFRVERLTNHNNEVRLLVIGLITLMPFIVIQYRKCFDDNYINTQVIEANIIVKGAEVNE